MANTYVDYTATAAQQYFAFNFPYLEDDHVIVEIEGVDQTITTNYTIETSPSQRINLSNPTTALAGGELVRIKRRSAPNTNLVDFQNGSVLTESELDRAYLHNRYLAEEANEGVDSGLKELEGSTNYNAGNKQIKNLADGTLATDAVNKGYVDTQIALTDTNLAGFYKSTHTGNAVDNVFTLSFTPQTTEAEAYIVSIDGLVQVPDTDYTIGATAITFNTIPANSAEICVVATAAASVATVNEAQVTATGSTTARSLADRFSDVVNVLDFGAVAGTGSNNPSRGAFQNAIDYLSSIGGGTLLIPEGNFYIEDQLNLISDIKIIGAGKGITTLTGALRTTPNTEQVSQNIFYGDTVSNVEVRDITFDGAARPVFYRGDGPAKALVDFETSNNISIENCDFKGFIYSLEGTETLGQSSYKVGALFAYDSSYISVKNVEYKAPTYGNLLMFIECDHVFIDGAKSIFSGDSQTSTNETPLNIWGDSCQYVTIQNCEFANNYGSAINLGGLGSFIIKNNRFYDTAGGVGSGIDLSNEAWVTDKEGDTTLDMHNVIVDSNTFTDVSATLQIGDVRSAKRITSHEVVVTNNVYQMTSGGQNGSFLVGNSNFVNVTNNTFNGAYIRFNYNDIATAEGNILYGRQSAIADLAGVIISCRAEQVDSYHYIKDNTISDWSAGALEVLTFFASTYSNVVFSNNDILYRGTYTPTDGQYITVTRSGNNPLYPLGDLTISENRLNGLKYNPFQGTDTEIYATNYYTGTGATQIGLFSRDTTLATGTQSVTGIGFKPKTILFFASEGNTGEASFGFSNEPITGGSTSNLSVNCRTATSPGTFNANTSSIFSWQSSGVYYQGSLASIDNDGFTISWTKVGATTGTLQVAYLAIA